MRKILALLFALLAGPALPADNYTATAGSGLTFAAKDNGSTVYFPRNIMCDNTTTTQCVAIDASGRLTTLAVQSGTWTVQPGNTANTTPWLVTGSGTAGSAATGVLTVQGIASMTPLFMASATAPVSTMNSATANAGINSALAGVFDDTSPTAITENSFGFLRMSANRNLYGTIRDAAGNERGVNVNASNQLAVAGPVTVVSGGVASGAIAAGALASGAGVDGWDLTQGAIADAAVTAGATGSVSAKLRSISRDVGTVATNSALPLPVQTGIGNVNIGAVQSAGSAYETVAASQTGQALGATGATGDYLSHCVIYPVTTGAGAVTVFDNTNAAGTNVITFTSGTLSNLAPIAIPVGALSTAGAWKVTTGTNVTVTCYGKFT